MKPTMVFATESGEIFDHPFLEAMGKVGNTLVPVEESEWLPLPDGTKLFTMPGRLPAGWNPKRKCPVVLEETEWQGGSAKVQAASVFLPPAYMRTFLPAAVKQQGAPLLPLWAYGAVGWAEGRFWAAGVRVDETPHWDPENYDDRILSPIVNQKLAGNENRLLDHLRRCAMEYHCFAAKNMFYGRWECPIPVSPVCNADCVGCISLQTEGVIPSSHERLNFLPTVEEITDIAVPHLEKADEAVVSFGQGCEGEPLLQADLIEETIRRIRSKTDRGVIHMNSNGSRPKAVERLCRAGLNSIRVSLNSVQPAIYAAYYRPKDYSFEHLRESLKIASDLGAFTSINLLTFPGLTDDRREMDLFLKFLSDTRLAMIQWKNLNIDPDKYSESVDFAPDQMMGMRKALSAVRESFPRIVFGYFNRPKEAIRREPK